MALKQIIVAASLLSFASVAASQQEETRGANDDTEPVAVSRYKDWQLHCRELSENGQTACSLSQQLVTNEERRFALRIDVSQFPDGRGGVAPMVVITAPMGVYLPGGIRVQIDNLEPATLPYHRCMTNLGCNTWLPVTDAMLESLRAGNTANVTIKTSDSRDVNLAVSLLGFSAGYEALMSGGINRQ